MRVLHVVRNSHEIAFKAQPQQFDRLRPPRSLALLPSLRRRQRRSHLLLQLSPPRLPQPLSTTLFIQRKTAM